MSATPIIAILQAGRLEAEALLLAASAARVDMTGYRLTFVEPQPGPLWDADPTAHVETRAALRDLGAAILPMESRVFGARYPNGNKIEALGAVPDGPFVFLDTDTLILAPPREIPFDFARPSASLRREGTWPKGPPGPVWRALYQRFGIDIAPTLDPDWPAEDWRHYLYFNAGAVFGASAHAFHRRWLDIARAVEADPPAGETLDPWLDQATLPLVIAALGGGRDAALQGLLDGAVTCHYRTLPLLFARESDQAAALVEEIAQGPLKRLLKRYPPFRDVLYETGKAIRAKYHGRAFESEAALRKALRADGYWIR